MSVVMNKEKNVITSKDSLDIGDHFYYVIEDSLGIPVIRDFTVVDIRYRGVTKDSIPSDVNKWQCSPSSDIDQIIGSTKIKINGVNYQYTRTFPLHHELGSRQPLYTDRESAENYVFSVLLNKQCCIEGQCCVKDRNFWKVV